MPLLGAAAMLLSFDVDAAVVDEHDRWHTQEHLPERLSIPGFRRGTRWTALTPGAPRYMVLYEVDGLDTLASPAYLARLNDPTPWTQRMMAHYRGMRRGLCAVLGSAGLGQGGTAAVLRFTPEPAGAEALHRSLIEAVLPDVASRPGFGSAHLLQGAQAAAMTNEQRIRGADQGVASALVLTGYDEAAVAACAREWGEAGGLAARGARDVTSGLYRYHCSLLATEVVAEASAPQGTGTPIA